MFTKIAIIGTGNIGTFLFQTLQNQNNISVISVSGRMIEDLPKDCDLYIFALKDDVYEVVLQKIPFKMSCAVHTSGALSQGVLAPYAERVGVVYPYQSINEMIRRLDDEMIRGLDDKMIRGLEDEMMKKTSLLPSCVPVCVEGGDLEFEERLFQWAKVVFENVRKVNEKQRFAMHLAAVFANNFTNAMCGIAYQIFKENDLDWSLINPLLENTLEKVKYNDPFLVQTGPAARNDVSIMEKHCNALKDEDLKELYQLVSKIIQNKLLNL